MLDIRYTRPRLFFLLIVVSAWTAFGLFFGTQNYIRDVYIGKQASLEGYIIGWLVCGYSWAILTVPILRFIKRFSLERLGWLLFFAVHIPASVVFSSIALALYVTLSTLLFGSRGRPGTFFDYYLFLYGQEFESEELTYLLILSVSTVYAKLSRQPAIAAVPVVEPTEDAQPENTEPATPEISTNGTNGHSPAYLDRISIKDNGRIAIVETDKIHAIVSYGNYLKVYSNGSRYVHRETMTAIEQKLDPKKFTRIRRSAMVKIGEVQELRPISNGEFEVVLKNGTTLTSTRRYRKNLETLINN